MLSTIIALSFALSGSSLVGTAAFEPCDEFCFGNSLQKILLNFFQSVCCGSAGTVAKDDGGDLLHNMI